MTTNLPRLLLLALAGASATSTSAMRVDEIYVDDVAVAYIDPNFNADAQTDPQGSENASTRYFDLEQVAFDASIGYTYEFKVHDFLLRQAGDPDSQNLTAGGDIVAGTKVRGRFEIFEEPFQGLSCIHATGANLTSYFIDRSKTVEPFDYVEIELEAAPQVISFSRLLTYSAALSIRFNYENPNDGIPDEGQSAIVGNAELADFTTATDPNSALGWGHEFGYMGRMGGQVSFQYFISDDFLARKSLTPSQVEGTVDGEKFELGFSYSYDGPATNFGATLNYGSGHPSNSYGRYTINYSYAATETVDLSLGIGYYDFDEDGMPNNWEDQFGLNKLVDDSGLDKDKDKQTNLDEFLACTEPDDPLSSLRIRNAYVMPGTRHFCFEWDSVPNKHYDVLRRNSLKDSWQTLAPNITATGTSETYTHLNGLDLNPSSYYAIRINPTF